MGIFDRESTLFTTYRATLVFRGKVMGGTPKDPKLIEGWIRAKAGVSDTEELRHMVYQTLAQLGADVSPGMSMDEMIRASEHLAAVKQTVGFKHDDHGLYLEARHVKAMLKESVNILFDGDKWGQRQKRSKDAKPGDMTGGKGPKAFVAERVFVNPDRIYLGAAEPSGVDMLIGHIEEWNGNTRSTLTYHEYVERPTIRFEVMVARDSVPHEAWPLIWQHAQENGLGAVRSQSYGRFDIEQWEPVPVVVTNGLVSVA